MYVCIWFFLAVWRIQGVMYSLSNRNSKSPLSHNKYTLHTAVEHEEFWDGVPSVSQSLHEHLPRAPVCQVWIEGDKWYSLSSRNLIRIEGRERVNELLYLDKCYRISQKHTDETFCTEFKSNINEGFQGRVWPGTPGKYLEANSQQCPEQPGYVV